jgi:hypothetical protein
VGEVRLYKLYLPASPNEFGEGRGVACTFMQELFGGLRGESEAVQVVPSCLSQLSFEKGVGWLAPLCRGLAAAEKGNLNMPRSVFPALFRLHNRKVFLTVCCTSTVRFRNRNPQLFSSIMAKDWEVHKDEIGNLYVTHNFTLREVMEAMETNHNFRAS